MAAPNLSALVTQAWDDIRRNVSRPGYFVVLETKDGRRFVTHIQFIGKYIECPVEYRPRKNSKRGYGPIYSGHFDLVGEAVMVSGHALALWRQRRGPNEPRFTVTSRAWVPIEQAPTDLNDLRPKPVDWKELFNR